MQALADFAGGMTLDPKEIDKERGVVVEEWRGGLGAGSRLRDQQIPVLFAKSKYAERLPIGKPEILKSFPPSEIKAFYTKWYRPDRMAVVAVGDMDVAALEALVKQEFGPLKNPAAAAPARDYPMPLAAEVLVKMASDPEATQSSVSIVRKRPRAPEGTVGDYKRTLVASLAYEMINDRFDEISRKADAPFLNAGAYGGDLTPTVDTFTLAASVQDGKIERGLVALEAEANRVEQYGFGAGELERARKWMIASYDRAYAERDKTESSSYVQEYIGNFLQGEPTPGIDYEHKLVQALVPTITAEEVAAAAKSMFGDTSRVILGVSPQKAGVTIPTDAQIVAAVAAADKLAVTPWTDTASTATLMATVPDPGTVSVPAGDPGARRHGRHVVERRRSLAEAYRLQERSGALCAGLVWWQLARAARQVRRGPAGDRAGRVVGRRRAPRDRSAEADRREDRVSVAVHLAVVTRHPGVEHAGQPRDGLAAPQHQVHRARRRSGSLRIDPAPARSRRRQSLEQPDRGLRRQARAGLDDGALHVDAADRRSNCQARSAGDGLFLSRALRQRWRLQLLHRRRLQSRRGAAVADPLRRIPAVDEAGDRALQGRRAGVSRKERNGTGREGEGAQRTGGDQLLRRSTNRGERADARRSGDRSARNRPARHPARRDGRDLQRIGRPFAGDAAARRWPHRHFFQRIARQPPRR